MTTEEQVSAFYALKGDLFDGEGHADNLRHRDRGEALGEAAPAEWLRGDDGAIRFVAYRLRVVGEEWKEDAARELVDALREKFDAEDGFGHPDEMTPLDDDDWAALRAKARALVNLFLGMAPVRAVDEVGEVMLSPAAARTILLREKVEF